MRHTYVVLDRIGSASTHMGQVGVSDHRPRPRRFEQDIDEDSAYDRVEMTLGQMARADEAVLRGWLRYG